MGVDPLELTRGNDSSAGHAGEDGNGASGGGGTHSGGTHSGGTHSSGSGGEPSFNNGGDHSAGNGAGGANEVGGQAGESAAGASGQGGEGGEPNAVQTRGHISVGTFGPWVCGINDGKLYCWEPAFAGRDMLARDPENPGDPVVPGPVAGRSGTFSAEQISAGRFDNCAIQDGRVYCWGSSLYGRLGQSGGPLGAPVKGDVDFTDVITIHTGGSFSCAQTRDLSVFCWGDHGAGVAFGQLTSDFEATRDAKGQPSFVEAAFRIDSLKGATALAIGDDHGCASLANGKPVCWGRNDFRQAGQAVSDTCSSVENSSIEGACVKRFAQVAGLGPVRQFALGEMHSCALEASGKVRCWGNNSSFQLGGNASDSASCTGFDGSKAAGPCSATPVEVPEAEGASSIAARGYTSCAVKQGEVWCWGDNWDNVLGRGSDATALPGRVKLASGGLLEDVVEMALGENVACALTHDSKLFCWGHDYKTDTLLEGAIPVSW